MADIHSSSSENEGPPSDAELRSLYRQALQDPEFAAERAASLRTLSPNQLQALAAEDRAWLDAQTPPADLEARLMNQYDAWLAGNREPAAGRTARPPRRTSWFMPSWRDFGVALPSAALGVAATLMLVTFQPPAPDLPDFDPTTVKGFDFGDPTSAQARLRHIADLLEKGETEAARQEWQAFRKAYPELLP